MPNIFAKRLSPCFQPVIHRKTDLEQQFSSGTFPFLSLSVHTGVNNSFMTCKHFLWVFRRFVLSIVDWVTILPPGGIGAEATYVRDFPSRKRTSVVNIFYNSRKIVNLTSKKFAKRLAQCNKQISIYWFGYLIWKTTRSFQLQR